MLVMAWETRLPGMFEPSLANTPAIAQPDGMRISPSQSHLSVLLFLINMVVRLLLFRLWEKRFETTTGLFDA